MKKILVFFILSSVFALGLTSCRKEIPFDSNANADTLFPKPYLPLYPGSYWTYISSSDTFTESVGAYTIGSILDDFNHSQDYYVPTWKGRQYFGYGYQRTSTAFTKELEEQDVGSWLVESYSNGDCTHGGCYNVTRWVDSTAMTVAVDTFIFSDVVRIWERKLGVNFGPYENRFYYYAKDVGLVKCELITGGSYPNWTVSTVYYVTDYFIND
jgi:hypothetical protein